MLVSCWLFFAGMVWKFGVYLYTSGVIEMQGKCFIKGCFVLHILCTAAAVAGVVVDLLT